MQNEGMTSSIGIDSPEDHRILAEAISITHTYQALTAISWPGEEGSELARLDEAVEGNITITDTLVSSQRTARASILHLATLLEQGMEPRATIAVALSRAALVGAGRIIFVLGPADAVDRQRNAEKVITRQLGSHLSASRATSNFRELASLKAPDDLIHTLQECKETIPGGGIGDGLMIKETAQIMAKTLIRQGLSDEDTAQLSEHLEWMWHIWSGVAHGWAWPKYFPGIEAETHDVAPGHWVTDFRVLTSVVQVALQLLRDGLRV